MSLRSEQHIDEITVLHVLVIAILLLEYHVGGVESLESLLNHLELSDNLATEAKLSHDTVNCSVICVNGLEIKKTELAPFTPSLWEEH